MPRSSITRRPDRSRSSTINEGTFRKLSEEGRRLPDHPLGQRSGWPQKFSGTWERLRQFLALHRAAAIARQKEDGAGLALEQRDDQSAFSSTYNFRPKTEWPVEIPNSQIRNLEIRDRSAHSLDDFQLPPKSVFDSTMPRYPNVWFYVDTSLAASYEAAVKLVTENLRKAMHLREYYGPFDNPEGCDFEVRLEHLQPWEDREHRALQHSHAFHMRYYYSALARQKLDQVKLKGPNGERESFIVSPRARITRSNTPTRITPMSKSARSAGGRASTRI